MNGTQFLPFVPFVMAVAIAVVVIGGERSLLGDERSMFSYALAKVAWHDRERIAAAIERRRIAERFAPFSLWAGLAMLFLVALASAFRVLEAEVATGLVSIVYALASVVQVASAQRGDRGRRVASLKERTVAQLVPGWLLCVPLLSSVAGLAAMRVYGFSIPMLLGILAPLFVLASLPLVARTPAIVGSDDPRADEIVDEKVRASRLRQMLLISSYAPLLMMFVVVPADVENAAVMRSFWMLALTALVLWSNRRLRFSEDELHRMYGR